jgi:hypothetical protein
MSSFPAGIYCSLEAEVGGGGRLRKDKMKPLVNHIQLSLWKEPESDVALPGSCLMRVACLNAGSHDNALR